MIQTTRCPRYIVGNVGVFFNTSAGDYRLDRVRDPDFPNRTLEVLLLQSGSDANLLPESLRSPLKASIMDFNASGGVVGNYHGINGSAYYYNVETKELLDLKSLPGAMRSPQVYGINDHGQIVGAEDGKAILYASPEAVPVELIGLLADGSGWNNLLRRRPSTIAARSPAMAAGLTTSLVSISWSLRPFPSRRRSSCSLRSACSAPGSRRSGASDEPSPPPRDVTPLHLTHSLSLPCRLLGAAIALYPVID
jgi:hypothetical protein